MRHPAPERFTLSGPEARNHHFYETRLLSDKEGRSGVLVLAMRPEGVLGLRFAPNSEQFEMLVPNAELSDYEFWVTMYYHGYTIRSESPERFIIQWLIQYPWFATRSERFAQYRFNRIPLEREERMNILRIYVSKTTENTSFRGGELWLLEHLHTKRGYSHPGGEYALRHYEMVLDSLVHTGDLRKLEYGYQANPAAIATLAQYELEERRFRDEISQQRRIGRLTTVLIFIGILQAMATFLAPGGEAVRSMFQSVLDWFK